MPNPQDQRVQQSLNRVRQQYPNITGQINVAPSTQLTPGYSIGDLTPLMTTTGNTINYVPGKMMGVNNDADLDDAVAHELIHVRQNQQAAQLPWYQKVMNMFNGNNSNVDPVVPPSMKGTTLDNPYLWRPNEMEAFQEQRNRMMANPRLFQSDPATGTGDIYLPPENKKQLNTAPSFSR